MARILRGDIVWADLDPVRGREQAGKRPVPTTFSISAPETVIAVALTSQPQRAGFPLTLELSASGLPKHSRAKISHIRTLSVERIGRKVAHASIDQVARIIERLNEIIDG